MNKKNLYLIIGGGLIVVALMASLYLVRQNQNMNKSASGGGTGLSILPDAINKKIGEEFTVQVMASTGGKAIDTTKTKICFNKNNIGLVNINPTNNITLNNSVFDSVNASISEDGDNECLIIDAINTSTASTSQGEVFKLFDLKLKALAVSEGNINIIAANTEMWGLSSTGEKYQIAINVSNGAAYKITANDVAGAKIYLSPSSVSKTINDEFTSELKVDSDKPVNSMRFYFCYKSDLLRLVDQTTIKNNFVVDSGVFDNVIPGTSVTEGENTCFDVLFTKITGQLNTATGTIKIADIKLKALKVGSGLITINKDKCEIGSQIIGSVVEQTYTISNAATTCTPQCSGKCGGSDSCNGTCPNTCNSLQTCTNNVCVAKTVLENSTRLKYKVSFIGVKSSGSDPSCTSDWPLTFTILDSNGVSKTYTSVPTKTTATNDVTIGNESVTVSSFEGTVNLVDLASKTNLAVFIKGPKHLQMKYGKDNQTSVYDKAGGEINLTDQTLIHDFSKYPILAGDVNNDGVVDGRDYSLVKAELASGRLGTQYPNSLLDLDGNCLVNAGDSTILKKSLVEKRGQLY